MERARLNRGPADLTLVRHIYDLHMMLEHIDLRVVTSLAHDIATQDAIDFRNKYPACANDIAGETARTVEAIAHDPIYWQHYNAFLSSMVYVERPHFEAAMGTVIAIAARTFQNA